MLSLPNGYQLDSHLLLGTAGYPSLAILEAAIIASATQIITVGLKKQSASVTESKAFVDFIRSTKCLILPNTAGCQCAKDAILHAEMARDIFDTNWIKLEIIGDEYTLQPNPFELVEAAKQLTQSGFLVFPYMTDDLVLAQRLVDVGCEILMPWAAPIGSGKGILNPYALMTLRARFPNITLIVDAGIGKPSHAAQVMELGFDAVLLNTAVSRATDPIGMAEAFAWAIEGGRKAYLAGIMPERDLAHPSTSLIDTPFWQQKS